MHDVNENVVIITGASGNLGRAAIDAFEAAGAHLVLVDRSTDLLAEKLGNRNGHLLVGGVDLTSGADAGRIVHSAINRFGRVDALLNIVGAYRGGANVADDSWETWQFCLDTNLRTAFEMSRAAARIMTAQRSGCIVNVASRNAFAGPAGYSAYSAAKSGVLRLTESLADEMRPHGVRVNCIVPGTLDTPANRQSMPNAPDSKFVAPGAVADVALFLASGAARAVSGVAIPVYGCVAQSVTAT
jgi:NAD(P)-dependent dehydrogenase (short-subunit alcohol dehydrogenase family)